MYVINDVQMKIDNMDTKNIVFVGYLIGMNLNFILFMIFLVSCLDETKI